MKIRSMWPEITTVTTALMTAAKPKKQCGVDRWPHNLRGSPPASAWSGRRTRADCGSQPVKVFSISKTINLLGFGELQVATYLRSRAMEEMNSALRPRCGDPYAAARQMWRVGWVVSLAGLSCMMLACRVNKNQSGPVIEFTRVPLAGEGGPDRIETIEGRVIRGHPGQRIVLFAQWGPWWVQPLLNQPFTTIQPDSRWRNSTHLGTQYAALLVDENYQPPATTDVLPSTGHRVVAVAVVKGRPVFWQTWWFLLTATLASAVIVAACFRYRMVRLANEEARFREAIETMPAMAFIARSDGYCTFVNRDWVKFTGLTVEQTSGSGWQAAVHPDDLSRVANRWCASLASGEPLEHEIRVRRVADGAYRWFLIRAVPLRDKRGKILKWCGMATDIEDRQRAQQL
jgi:PAS domain S-box-containing protein